MNRQYRRANKSIARKKTISPEQLHEAAFGLVVGLTPNELNGWINDNRPELADHSIDAIVQHVFEEIEIKEGGAIYHPLACFFCPECRKNRESLDKN